MYAYLIIAIYHKHNCSYGDIIITDTKKLNNNERIIGNDMGMNLELLKSRKGY